MDLLQALTDTETALVQVRVAAQDALSIQAAQSTAYAKLLDQHAALQADYDALKLKYDALVNTSPSGVPMPLGDLPGWKLVWAEDFGPDCLEGQFRAAYPGISLYPPKIGGVYHDTSGRGLYDPDIFSVHNSVLQWRIHTSIDGVHHVAAILPKLSTLGQYGAVSGGRFAVRFRADVIPTYKMAWLLWPNDGVWPKNGEIDFPECDYGSTIKGFMHRQGAVPGKSDQDSINTNVSHTDWHTCVTEWIMGKSLKFYLDDKLVKTVTTRVPATPMRWTLQCETVLQKTTPIDSTALGLVELDWAVYWAVA